MSEQSITVTIADRPYKIIVAETEKDNVLNAANVINKKLNEYAKSYSFKDKQDLLAMIVLQFATSNIKYEEKDDIVNDVVFEQLNDIEKLIDSYIEK
ncbi:MAG: cell division protein ZapA [Bacteroidota bacterium]|nr:cell division protein ZapA [Bacteroidota bacterium]